MAKSSIPMSSATCQRETLYKHSNSIDIVIQLSSTQFGCAFTSFVFIAWQPQKFRDNYFQSEPNTNIYASFDIYSLSTGQQIYTLQCPMNYPPPFSTPMMPRFQRTDESERYWLFPCSDIFTEEMTE